MRKFPIVISILFISIQFLTAQEVKFGEVTKEELLEKEYVNDKSANAVVVYKNQNTYYVNAGGDGMLMTKVHERIKIYNKDGFDYATKSINLFKTRHDSEGVSKIKAFTYNLENDKIVETELDKNQIFKTEASYNYKQVKFTMPNVKEGSVVEFSYLISSPFIWNIDEFRFQYDIPIKKLHAEIRTPKGFKFKQTFKGSVPFYPKESAERDNRIGMNVVINKYNLNNVPALKEENYVDNIDNYRAGVMFELVSVNIPPYFKSYAQTWKDVAQTIGNSDDYKNELDKSNSFDDELDILLANEDDQMGKMKSIFKYVKDNITWNGIDGKYFYNGLKKTLKEKKGNAADINLLTVAMLRYAGIDANPVIISTKENAVPFFPTVDRLNYVLAYAIINDKPYFLDATEEFSDVNLLPIKDYNWRGILIDNDSMKWDLIDINSPNKAQRMANLELTLNEDGTSEGKCSLRYTKHAAMDYRKEYKDKNEESYLTDLETRFNGIEVSNHETRNATTFEGPVSEFFDFFDENASEIINDKIYFQPLTFLKKGENPFKMEKREYPVDFGFPFKNTYVVNIKIPEGYSLESKPETILMKLPEDMGAFKYVINNDDNMIKLLVNYEINHSKIGADVYLYLKEFYKQIIVKESEQIVLSKI
ncbi:transglutaminase-like putative cysteine protease [Saonia flava]|uniref:Transglutaminase-like putative cysteine protease n=1 Tax=Saonia flava TaxID=523696 RepID=A0A846QX47_9FLAO|nr:transglutaminase domain-containing protein [Saonia flava]NJB70823.1 transglutaminase-like putative cysteine protease [Saonia flava]